MQEQQELRQEGLLREDIRQQLERQERIIYTMETLAAQKLQKLVHESSQRAEVLQGNKKLRDQHAALLKRLV